MSVRSVYERTFDEDDGKTINQKSCPECSGVLRTVGGETTCEECGLIVTEYRIDHSATPEDYPDDEISTAHTGGPLTVARHDRGLSTDIGRVRDARGNELSCKTRKKFSRLRRHHSRARYRSKAERNLIDAFAEIARLVSALDLPFSARERACQYFRTAHRENLIKGRSIDALAAASVYAACRCGDCMRTLTEVAEIAGCGHQKLRNQYRVLNAELGLRTKPPEPTAFISRITSECKISAVVRHRARELAIRAVTTGLSKGGQASSIAAACVYLAVQEVGGLVTQQELADAVGISPQTLRTWYQKLSAKLE